MQFCIIRSIYIRAHTCTVYGVVIESFNPFSPSSSIAFYRTLFAENPPVALSIVRRPNKPCGTRRWWWWGGTKMMAPCSEKSCSVWLEHGGTCAAFVPLFENSTIKIGKSRVRVTREFERSSASAPSFSSWKKLVEIFEFSQFESIRE